MKATNILIVEDEKINRTILIKAIKKIKNVNILEAENGLQALEIVSNNNVSLILLDIIMPVMDGFEFLENLADNSLIENLPIIVISALDDYQSIYKALKMGCWDYFTKPLFEDIVSKILPIKIKNVLTYKRAIDQIRTMNETLERKIKKSTQQLIHSDRLISMGILTGQIVHEINTPLTYLKGNIGILKTLKKLFFSTLEEKYPDIKNLKFKNFDYFTFKQKMFELLKASDIGINTIANIITTFRNFAKKDVKHENNVDLNEIIEKSLEITKNFTQNRIKIVKKLRKLPPIKGNPQKIEQIITNLIINASQAIENKGVITIESFYDDKSIYFKIADTGVGIDKKNLNKIFNLFYTTKENGTGFGLFIIKELLKEMRGDIKVESEKGVKTVFTISIPYK